MVERNILKDGYRLVPVYNKSIRGLIVFMNVYKILNFFEIFYTFISVGML